MKNAKNAKKAIKTTTPLIKRESVLVVLQYSGKD